MTNCYLSSLRVVALVLFINLLTSGVWAQGNCVYSEGQHLFTTSWGEAMYAHYHNGVLYAAYQDNTNFRPRHWLVATGQMTTSVANCFAQSDPHTSAPPTNPTPSSGSCSYTQGQFLFTTSWGESVYAHYRNNVLYAAYQDGSNFKPQHWLVATGQMTTSVANCFAQDNPHTFPSTSNPNPTPSSGNCSYTQGQFLFTTSWGESVYAHYLNGVLYAAYQNGSNFKPRHWLVATGQMTTSIASCFAENNPHTSPPTPTTNPNPTPTQNANCPYSEGQYLFTFGTEAMYAHYHNGMLYAAYQDKTNFKPRHWLVATGKMTTNVANCFAQNDPRISHTTPTTPTSPTNPSAPTAMPSAGGNFAGNLDWANCNAISGWVLNRNKLNQSTRIDIYVNGWLVATNIMAVRSRQDVANAFGVSGHNAFGFNVVLPTTYSAGVPLTISVKYAGTSTHIPGSPKTTATCANNRQFRSNAYIDPECNTGIARVIPGSEQTLSTAVAHTGTYSLKLSDKSSGGVSSLSSQLFAVKEGDAFTLNAYATALTPSRHNLTPQLTKALIGGASAGLTLAQPQPSQPDQRRLGRTLPILGISTALTLPLVKSLFVNRSPNTSLELAFYNQQGKFIYRQRVDLPKAAHQDWQLLHISGHAPQKGYVKFRLQNRSKTPVFFDDLTFQATSSLPASELDSKELGTKRSSTNGFPGSVSTAINRIYGPGVDCERRGGTDGAIVVDKIIFLDLDVRVTAQPPTYMLDNGVVIYVNELGQTVYPGGETKVEPRADITDRFNRQLQETKNHFCRQAKQIRNRYPTPPNWASPGDPQSGQVAELLRAFVDDVKTGGPYDLKNNGYDINSIGDLSYYNGGLLLHDDYGNINFGVAAAATGIPVSVAVCGAGIYQWFPDSGPVDFSNLGGCFDDGRDSAMIRMGYQMFLGCDNPVRTGNEEIN